MIFCLACIYYFFSCEILVQIEEMRGEDSLRAPMYDSLFIIFCNMLVHFVKFSKSFTTEVIKSIIGMLSYFIS